MDADEALVQREAERCRGLAGGDPRTPEHLFYMGWVDIFAELGTDAAAAKIRTDTMTALTGRRPVRVLEAAPRRSGWLSEMDDAIRRSSAIRVLNQERRALGLKPLREPALTFDEETVRHYTGRGGDHD